MNRSTVTRRMTGAARLGAHSFAFGVLILCAAGCKNPLVTYESDLGMRVPKERLRQIQRLGIEQYTEQTTPAEEAERAAAALNELPPLFEGREEMDVTLEQCRAWALSNNLDLQVALIEPTISSERLSEEEAKFEAIFQLNFDRGDFNQPTSSELVGNTFQTFDLNPSISVPLRTGGTFQIEMPLSRLETDNQFSTLNPSYSVDTRLSISQPLLRNAGRRTQTYSIRIQALETQISEAEAKLNVIRELANVDRTYWRLYAAREFLDVRISQYNLAKEQLERARRRVRAGDAAEVEVIRAESGVADQLGAIIDSVNAIRNAQRELKRVVNVPGLDVGSEVMLIPESAPDPVPYKLDGKSLANAGVANRMEMLELELRLAQDLSTIDYAKNQALPLFVLDYQYTFNGLGASFNEGFNNMAEARFRDWVVSGQLQVPLGNEAAESRVNEAIIRRLQRLSTRAARELAIRQEVHNAIDGLEASWQRILAARQAVILAERTLRAEENQFRVGARTSTDVLDAATRLADAQASEIRALTDYQVSQVDLAFATGTLLGADKIDWSPIDPRGPEDHFGEHRYVPVSRADEPETGEGG